MKSETYIVLYDGICGLCHRTVRQLIRADRDRKLRYAPLQGVTAQEILQRHGHLAKALDGIWFVSQYKDSSEQLFTRSDAIIEIAKQVHAPFSWFKWLKFFPRFIREWAYGVVATNRYSWFGKKDDACQLPSPQDRELMLP